MEPVEDKGGETNKKLVPEPIEESEDHGGAVVPLSPKKMAKVENEEITKHLKKKEKALEKLALKAFNASRNLKMSEVRNTLIESELKDYVAVIDDSTLMDNEKVKIYLENDFF